MHKPSHRQLAAVMFTDIVDYTRLMQGSESTAVQVRQRHRKVFEAVTKKYDGQIINYYGDGTLSIFNSTVKAVQCAVELQKQFLREPVVPLRIGIHTGDIILTETDIIGDSVNLASRIESMGVAGCILVSNKVAEEIKNQEELPVKRIGAFHFKNVEKSMAIFALALPELVIPKARQLKGKLKKRGLLSKLRSVRISKTNAVLSIILLIVILSAVWLFDRQAKIRWARYEALPRIEELLYIQDYAEAYRLAEAALQYIPQNEKLREMLPLTFSRIDIHTDPEGAHIYVKAYEHPEEPWLFLGVTPLQDVQLANDYYRWKVEKEGYATVYAVEPSNVWSSTNFGLMDPNLFVPKNFHRKLDTTENIPSGMTRVSGGSTWWGDVPDFFIDRYEVTNEQFKNFIANRGYQDRRFWKHPFIDGDKELSWPDAMARLVDQTGQPGPSTWIAGDYPEGQGDYPVGGISWYEAAAYAEYVNKTLPSVAHWWQARGGNMFNRRSAMLVPFSNFNQQGPVAVGNLPGFTTFGAYDMAGNVREWCWNETRVGRLLRGGAWNTNTYAFANLAQAPAFNRDPTNGFRCAAYPETDSLSDRVFERVNAESNINYELNPVPDEVFQVYREYFDYDKMPDQHVEILHRNDQHEDWTEEKVAFDAAYGNERVSGYLFLPKSSVPPYQVVIYWPGSGSVWDRHNYDSITEYFEFPVFLEFIVKTGRAVFYPVYKGTFDRANPALERIHSGNETHEFADYMTLAVKDFRTSIDYLERRGDIDSSKIALFGMSWGSVYGPVASAVEDRVRTNIFVSGGLDFKTRPEVFPLNFLPRVKVPTIMLNGRFDSRFSLEESTKPMFELLGCPAKDKKLVIFESEHRLPRNEMIKEILPWLDQQLGPVRRLAK